MIKRLAIRTAETLLAAACLVIVGEVVNYAYIRHALRRD